MAKGTRPRGTLAERFWAKVDRSGGPDACWLWMAARHRNGYGAVWDGERQGYAHRVSYELNVGPISHGHSVCHTCDTPPCVNPAHLFAAPQVENLGDASRKGRMPGGTLRGERHGRAKLTDLQVAEIRRRYIRTARGHGNGAALAREFGVDKSQVHLIVTNQGWT